MSMWVGAGIWVGVGLICALLAPGCSDDSGGSDGNVGAEAGGSCDPGTCNGCCLGMQCKKGDEAAACGSAGLSCVSCPDGESCVTRQCIVASGKCNINNCPDGCCAGDQCQSGTVDSACGQGGRVCQTCGSSSTCIDRRCDCDPSSCPGCCEAGICKPGTDREACGKGGTSCVRCKQQQICSSTTAQCKDTSGCSPADCKGCCDGPECKSGVANTFCGKSGIACRKCATGESCQSGICNNPSTCGPGKCNGCCSASICLTGSTKASCGTNGGLCETCKSHEKCTATGCELDNDALWGISVVKATIDPSKSWDNWPANSAPDVYVEIKIGSLNAKTSQKDNDYDPIWNEYVGKVKAGVLLNLPIEVKVLDNDSPFGPETVGACKVTVPLNVLVSGNDAVVNDCGAGHVKKLYLKFTPQ